MRYPVLHSFERLFKTSLLTFIFFIFFTSLQAQVWPKVYGDNIIAIGWKVMESYDHGYFICGASMKNPSTYKYGWVVKTDINGNVLWDKKFGDTTREDYFLDAQKTLDNGWIIAGATSQLDSWNDAVFVKLDACGEIEWCKIYPSPELNYASNVIALPNGDFIGNIGYYGGNGYQYPRISLVRMDASGEPLWIKNIGFNDTTISNYDCYHLYYTPDSNVMITGRCFSPLKPYIVKTDTEGEELWSIKWEGRSGSPGNQAVFTPNSDKVYIGAGLHALYEHNRPFMIKCDLEGNQQGEYEIIGDTVEAGGTLSMLMWDDSTLFAGVGWMKEYNMYHANCEIMKIDTLGNILDRRLLNTSTDALRSIVRTFDDKLLLMGTFAIDGNWDIYMWKTGTDLVDDTVTYPAMNYDSLCPVSIRSDTVALDCGIFVNIDEIPTKEEYESSVKISPNPAVNWITLEFPDNVAPGKVSLSILNTTGQQVFKTTSLPSERMESLNISGLSAGLYILVCKDSKNQLMMGKFIKGM